MRQLINYILILFLVLQSCGNQEPVIDQNRIVLNGQVKGIADTTLEFTFEPYGLLESSRSIDIKVDSIGGFNLIMDSKNHIKGFLSFGKIPKTYKFDVELVDGKDTSMQVGSVDFRMVYFYLCPGDSLLMKVDPDNIRNSLKFSGEGAENNYFVNQEEWEFNNYKNKYLNNYYYIYAYQADAYKKQKEDLRNAKKHFLDNFQKDFPLDEHLVSLYNTQYNQEIVRSMISYPDSHSGFNNNVFPELPADYYDFINEAIIPENIDNMGISAYYYLNSLLRKKWDLSDQKKSFEFYDFIDHQLPERLAFVFKAHALDRDFKKELYDIFDESCPYPDIAMLVKKKYGHLEGMLAGNPFPDFILEDINGNNITPDNLLGNFVYIDFWATWCKPCIGEIPYLEELQEELKEKPIKFVSISIDKEKDKTKWQGFVKENNMKGLQLWANNEHQDLFSKSLNIKSIPRFVLLDKEGKIINAQEKRPSDPKLKVILDELTDR